MNDAVQKNIVMMSQFEKPRIVPGTSGAFLLNDCRDLAASRLVSALASMMARSQDDFFDLSEQSQHYEMHNLYMEAMTLVRDRQGAIGAEFKQQFVQGFNREARRGKYTQRENALDGAELSLVTPDDLEESLAALNIANGVHGDCAEELFGIEKRMGVLLHDPELSQTNNPLGPEVIGKAFMEALKVLDCPVKIKLLLTTQFNKHMPRQIKDIYRDINQHLVDKGVLEKIRVGAKKRAEENEMSLPPQKPAAGAPGQHEVASGDTGLFAALQQFLTRGSWGGSFASPAQGSGGAGPLGGMGEAGTAVVTALTRLQQGQLEGVAGAGGALDAAVFADGHANVLREIKGTSVGGSMGHIDAMTLDIVAMLFDYILDDSRIPDAMKALIGRLQIPVLKVAMLDKAFFSQKTHPARKLLDRLAEISIGWNEEEGHQGGLYKKVDDLVQRVLNEFDDKVGIFAELAQDLEQYLAAEKKRADELTGLSAQIVHHREQEEIARIMAHEEIRRRIHMPLLPEVIGSFLAGCWERVLAAGYAQGGEDGESWARGVETMDELIWSVAPKRVPEDRKQLVSLLPGLLKRLQDGMVLAGLAEAEREQFFARLVKCHADAIKSGLEGQAQESAAQEAAFVAQAFDAEDAAEIARQADEPGDFMEVPVLLDAIEPDPVFVQAVSAEAEADSGWQTFTISDANWQLGQENAGDEYDAMVKRLKRGSWIELGQENGAPNRVKLAWVSPLKGLYLFTNRLGQNAASITPVGLAEKFRSGHAHIIDDIALMDNAVNQLVEQLKQAA